METNWDSKTKSLSILEYIEALNFECVQAHIRSRIHNTRKNKDYWERVFERKKSKILEISKRNGLTTIFDDSDRFNAIFEKIVPLIGPPKFTYKDFLQKNGHPGFPGLQIVDLESFYGTDVIFKVPDRTGKSETGYFLGKVISQEIYIENDEVYGTIQVSINETGQVETFDIKECRRII